MQDANVYALFWSLYFVATTVVALRLLIRLRYGQRRLFAEDYLIILAWLAYVALEVILTLGVVAGLAATTRGDYSFENQTEVLKYFFFHGYPLYTALWLVKASIISFYARLSWNSSLTYRVLTYLTIGILICTYIAVIIYKSFYCFPLPRIWNPSDQCTGGSTAQYTRTAYLTTTSLLDICTDVLCLVLPFSILRNLKIDLRKKIALGFLFGVALMSLVCSCIRLYSGIDDGTKFSVAIWGIIEATTAISVASAPALRPLIFRTSYFQRGTSSRELSGIAKSGGRRSQLMENGVNDSSKDSSQALQKEHRVQVTKSVRVTTTDRDSDGISYREREDSFSEVLGSSKGLPPLPSEGSGLDVSGLGFTAEVVAGKIGNEDIV